MQGSQGPEVRTGFCTWCVGQSRSPAYPRRGGDLPRLAHKPVLVLGQERFPSALHVAKSQLEVQGAHLWRTSPLAPIQQNLSVRPAPGLSPGTVPIYEWKMLVVLLASGHTELDRGRRSRGL